MSRVAAYVADRKVEGLRAGRDELGAAYDAIEAHANAAPDARSALGRLVAGLASVRLGDKPAHADLPALDAVVSGGDTSLVAGWTAALRRRIAQGRARADLLPLVAGVLGEAARPGRRRPAPDPAVVAAERDAWTTPAPGGPLVRDALAAVPPDVRARIRAAIGERLADLDASWPHPRVDGALLREEDREEARRWGRSELTSEGQLDPEIRDLQGALRLRWRDVRRWDHEGPVALVPTWTRTRWRLRPALDWLSAWTVEAVGEALRDVSASFDGVGHVNRRLRLERLLELDAPEIIVENERRMVAETFDPFGRYGALTLGGPESVRRARLSASRFSADADYGGDYGGTEIARATGRLAAEVALARAHGRATWVVKSDLADFYPSVSHALVAELLRGVGLPDDWVALVGRCLSLPLPDGRRTARGLPLGWTLSRVLGDLLVGVLVGRVRAAAPEVEVLTLVDDVWFLAPDRGAAERAWTEWTRAVADAGLAVNLAKSGSVAIGADGPVPVPGAVTWGLLRLDADGEIRVDEAALAASAALARARVDATEAVLERVEVLREQLGWVVTWLAPSAPVGEPGVHLERVRAALAAWWSALDPETSLSNALAERFLGGARPTVPVAWLRWPVTAGGLGLPWWPAELAGRRPDGHPPPPADPAAEPLEDEAWGQWFASCLAPAPAVAPVSTPEHAAWLERFVARGTQLGRAPTPLAPYWQWVLSSHGEQILDAFGTWDFVPVDLVPVELLRGR